MREETHAAFGETLARAIKELRMIQVPIRSLDEFDRVHAIALTKYWLGQGNVAATIQTKSSVLRRFLTLVGKPAAMPRGRAWWTLLEENGINTDALRNPAVSSQHKAWQPQGVNPLEIIARIAQEEPIIAAEMELQLAFGLNVDSALRIQPVLADAGTRLHVSEGRNGRLTRWVEFDPNPGIRQWQREILDRAKELAERHPKKRLSLPGLTLEQMRNRYYYVLRKHGVTYKQLGVVSHGLRSELASPRPDVSAELPARLGRQARRQVVAITADLQHPAIPNFLQSAGVQDAWFVGRVAYGLPLSRQQPLEIVARFDGVSTVSAAQLQAQLESVVERPLMVTGTTDPAQRPPDGVPWSFRCDEHASIALTRSAPAGAKV